MLKIKKIAGILLISTAIFIITSCSNNDLLECLDGYKGDICLEDIAYTKLGEFTDDLGRSFILYNSVSMSISNNNVQKIIISETVTENENKLIPIYSYIDYSSAERIRLVHEQNAYTVIELAKSPNNEILENLKDYKSLEIKQTSEDEIIHDYYLYNLVNSTSNFGLYKHDYEVCTDLYSIIYQDDESTYIDLGCESYVVLFDGEIFKVNQDIFNIMDIDDLLELEYPLRKI